MRSLPVRAGIRAGVWTTAVLGGLLGLSACPSSDNCKENPDDPSCVSDPCKQNPGDPSCPVTGPAVPSKGSSIGSADRPLAAVLDAEGKTVFFAAYDDTGQAQLYTAAAAGGSPTLLPTGNQLSHPVGMAIKPDGSALFIADIGDPGGMGGEIGAVHRLALPSNFADFSMGALRQPAGVAVSNDGKDVYVTGMDKDDGQPGVWRFADAGGSPTLVYKGDKLSNPSGITMANDGTIYVVDPTALGPQEGAVLKIGPSSATVISKTPLIIGFPAGIAPAGMGHPDVLISGVSATSGKGVIYRVTPAGEVSELAVNTMPVDPGMLQRAAKANAWVAVDSVSLPMSPDPDKAPGQLFQLTP